MTDFVITVLKKNTFNKTFIEFLAVKLLWARSLNLFKHFFFLCLSARFVFHLKIIGAARSNGPCQTTMDYVKMILILKIDAKIIVKFMSQFAGFAGLTGTAVSIGVGASVELIVVAGAAR